MGKATQVDGDNNPTSPESDPTKLLEAALLQMDGIIAGKSRPLQITYLIKYQDQFYSNLQR